MTHYLQDALTDKLISRLERDKDDGAAFKQLLTHFSGHFSNSNSISEFAFRLIVWIAATCDKYKSAISALVICVYHKNDGLSVSRITWIGLVSGTNFFLATFRFTERKPSSSRMRQTEVTIKVSAAGLRNEIVRDNNKNSTE